MDVNITYFINVIIQLVGEVTHKFSHNIVDDGHKIVCSRKPSYTESIKNQSVTLPVRSCFIKF